MLEALFLEYGQNSQRVYFEENSTLPDEYVLRGGCTLYVPGPIRSITVCEERSPAHWFTWREYGIEL